MAIKIPECQISNNLLTETYPIYNHYLAPIVGTLVCQKSNNVVIGFDWSSIEYISIVLVRGIALW